jgi:hypothetical protein
VTDKHGLERHGIVNPGTVYWNLSVEALYEAAVANQDGMIAAGGAFACTTGQHTGRSPRDKFVVEDSGSASARRPAGRLAGRLNAPRPALVEAGPGGLPATVDRELVTLVREEWRVVDRWWTEEPVKRRYFELVLADGRNLVVFREPAESGRWFEERG